MSPWKLMLHLTFLAPSTGSNVSQQNSRITTSIVTNAEKVIQKSVTTFNSTPTDQPEVSSAYRSEVTSTPSTKQLLDKPFIIPTASPSVKPFRLTSSASYVQTVNRTSIVHTVHSFRIPPLSPATNQPNVLTISRHNKPSKVISTASSPESSHKSAVAHTVSIPIKPVKKTSRDTAGNPLHYIRLFILGKL